MSTSTLQKERVAPQTEARAISLTRFMKNPAFRRGFSETRAGLLPDFDASDEDAFQYEIGRQFAVICPRNIPLMLVNGKLNPAASDLFKSFSRNVPW
jgi:hypothetical protein